MQRGANQSSSRSLVTMPKRCVAAGCSNTYSNKVSLFKLPKVPVLRQKWVKQVQRTRAEWSGPSDHSVLCSDHFDSSCFEPDTKLASQMGIQKIIRLKEGAVPTIFERQRMSGGSVPMASLDQDLVQVSSDPGPSTQHSRKRTSSPSGHGIPKKKRTAYEKRERCRVSIYS